MVTANEINPCLLSLSTLTKKTHTHTLNFNLGSWILRKTRMRCSRGCLYSSMRILNLIINLCGILMIIYSLWLLKKWDEGVTQLPFSASIPRPWFISTCLVVGIVVCLSTLSGHMVANCISNYTLAIYIISIFSLLLIQAGVIVTIFFRMDWESEIIKYIDENHESFKSFILFHLVMCRLIAILVFVAQVKAIVFAVILWFLGCEPRIHCRMSEPLDFQQSFLVVDSEKRDVGLKFKWRE